MQVKKTKTLSFLFFINEFNLYKATTNIHYNEHQENKNSYG